MGRPLRRPTHLLRAGPRIWHGPRRQMLTPAPCPSALVVRPGGWPASQLLQQLHALQLPVARRLRRTRHLPSRTRSQPSVRQRERAIPTARKRSHRAQPRLPNEQRRPASPRYPRRSLPRRRLPWERWGPTPRQRWRLSQDRLAQPMPGLAPEHHLVDPARPQHRHPAKQGHRVNLIPPAPRK